MLVGSTPVKPGDKGPNEARLEPRHPTKNRVFETMTSVEVRGLIVRVWREEPTFQCMLNKIDGDPEVRSMIMTHSFSRASILVAVGEMPRVAAIEVLDATTRCGALFYPDWR